MPVAFFSYTRFPSKLGFFFSFLSKYCICRKRLMHRPTALQITSIGLTRTASGAENERNNANLSKYTQLNFGHALKISTSFHDASSLSLNQKSSSSFSEPNTYLRITNTTISTAALAYSFIIEAVNCKRVRGLMKWLL